MTRSTCTGVTRPPPRPRIGVPTKWSSERRGPDVAEQLLAALAAAGADALNVRVHVPGVTVGLARDQIGRLGDEVLPFVKEGLLRINATR